MYNNKIRVCHLCSASLESMSCSNLRNFAQKDLSESQYIQAPQTTHNMKHPSFEEVWYNEDMVC